MARGVASPAPLPVPKPSFTKIVDEGLAKPAGLHDLQARSYGYNDFSNFQRPEHYIRHIEPLESELAVQVEYDMDEQDQEWLDAVNAERKKEQLDKVSYETFEVIMDRLEKEWFDLTKNLPKPDMALPSEDSTCAICDDSEGENSNAIVFCDGCNLAVHQDCYGVPYIPEGQWLCRKCTVSPENPVSCILCPNEGGAFKQTVDGLWVHLLCAIWVPETRVVNDVFMEPITGIEKVPKQRWKLKCSVCDIREGACIQCNKASCFLAFHPTCARKEKYLMPMKSTQGSEPVTLACYCEKHLPKEQQESRRAALAAEEEVQNTSSETDEPISNNPLTRSSAIKSKSARAYAKSYTLGPPLVPHIILTRILAYIQKVPMRKRQEFLIMVCKYWSLKREVRRGAPLLKRLHLEPWTAVGGGAREGGAGVGSGSGVGKGWTEEERVVRIELLKQLREDLASVQALAALSRDRENQKLEQAEIINDLFSLALYPHEPPLRMAFEKIIGFDRNDYFKNPVSRLEVPDYFDIIKKPMCWNIIDGRLDRHEYWDIQAFRDDVNLVLDNALLYNRPGSLHHKAAAKIRANSQPILEKLDTLAVSRKSQGLPMEDELQQGVPPLGDLEPPLPMLNLLVSQDAIAQDIDLILNADPVTSLFNYEFAKLKPPPPPPPPPKPKPKRDRKAERERRKLARELADASPGFRVPRTRKAVAEAAKFEAEAAIAAAPEPEPEVDVTGPGDEAELKKVAAKKKSKKATLPSQKATGPPPLVEEVTDKDSFKNFEVGWILPEGRRRRTRKPAASDISPAPPPPPPPKKRSHLARQKSRLSVVTTSAAENETLQDTLGEASTSKLSPRREVHSPMDVDEAAEDTVDIPQNELDDASSPLTTPEEEERNPLEVEEEADAEEREEAPKGPMIIEVLDTPATRREKSMRKKELRAQRLAQRDESETSSAGPSVVSRPQMEDLESELSELSDVVSEDVKEGGVVVEEPPKPTPIPAKPAAKGLRGEITLEEGKSLEGGTLVWAKMAGYPWWAAVVFEPDHPDVPANTLKVKPKEGETVLVCFFDTQSSWQWLDLSKLRMLGEDDTLDQQMLTQKFKSGHVRSQCREAYRRAKAEMEGPEDEEIEEVQAEDQDGSLPTAPSGHTDMVLADSTEVAEDL